MQDIILSVGKIFIVMYLFHVLCPELKRDCVAMFYSNRQMCCINLNPSATANTAVHDIVHCLLSKGANGFTELCRHSS
jgi:hypothetical protein